MSARRPSAASIVAAVRADEEEERRKATEIVRFLRLQRGVVDAQARYDRQARAFEVVATVADESVGLPSATLPDGSRVRELNRYETEYLFREIFVERAYFPQGVDLPAGALVLDVGANIGLFSLFVARHVPGARIVAFEPAPDAFAALAANVRDHGLPVTCLPVAASRSTGLVRLTVYPAASVFSGLDASAVDNRAAIRAAIEAAVDDPGSRAVADGIAQTRMQGAYELDVEGWSLPDILANLGQERVDLLKLDTEGNELDLLAALAPADWARIERVVMELHRPSDAARAMELLSAAGFACGVQDLDGLRGTGFSNLYARRRVPSADRPTGRPLPLASVAPWPVAKRLRTALDAYLGSATAAAIFEVKLGPAPDTDRRAASPAPPVARETLAFIATLWKEVLGVEVDGDEDFFALGGSSLTAVRMLSRVRGHFGREVRFDEFLEAPTAAALAARVSTLPPPPPG